MLDINLNLGDLNDKEVDLLLAERCSAQPIVPEFVEENSVNKSEAYNRFRDLTAKQQFRTTLIQSLTQALSQSNNLYEIEKIITTFKELAQKQEQDGAIIFGNMVDVKAFQKLVDSYTSKLKIDGSKSWIHSYINFGNHPDFINDKDFNGAFIHPLLIALIAYVAGGPIRIVDARGKDAEPLAIQAQDNMLHIDNTPFKKEYKIILTWERGKTSGPKGQNFVFIPGTHKGVRNCKLLPNNLAWSTEDGSIFITQAAVQNVFAMQSKLLGKSPVVVEATHPTMPLTTVFEAGALIHHRYRTKEQEKNVPRSCMIIALHRAKDNPGQFLSEEHLDKAVVKGSLLHLLMGKHSNNTEQIFIEALLKNIAEIAEKLNELRLENTQGAQVVPYVSRVLTEEELLKWQQAVTSAPTVEMIKINKAYFKLNTLLTHEVLSEMHKYDKHGPLDLILYEDGHEEIRKWARNKIREMPFAKLEARLETLAKWKILTKPSRESLLSLKELQKIANHLIHYIDALPGIAKQQAHLEPQEKISSEDAYRSVRQLIDDLGEAIVRCTSRQTFLSTSLFLFWACDELARLQVGSQAKPDSELLAISSQLMANYLATAILIERQIQRQILEKPAENKSILTSNKMTMFQPTKLLRNRVENSTTSSQDKNSFPNHSAN